MYKHFIKRLHPNCDTGFIAKTNGFVLYAPSNDVVAFTNAVNKMLASDNNRQGRKRLSVPKGELPY